MLIGARSTSRQSRFQPPDSLNKRQVSLREMLMFSYQSGRGRTVREIAQLSGRSPTTVGKYVKLAKTTTEPTQQPDVKAMMEQVIRHFVLYALLRNPAVSGAIMSCHLACIGLPASRSKVNRIARDLNFVSVYQAKREKLQAHHKEYRVTFSREVQCWSQFHLPWVFSDESMIVKNPFKKKIRVIRGLETTERFADYEGYPVKLIVWTCIGQNYKSKLIRVTGRLDAAGYCRLLEDNGVIEALDAEYGRMSFVWQQDGARPHKLMCKNGNSFSENFDKSGHFVSVLPAYDH